MLLTVFLSSGKSVFLYEIPVKYHFLFNFTGSGNYLEESAYCGLPMEIQHVTRPLLQAATFIFFIFPLAVILILYIKISFKLRSTKFARMTYTCSSRCPSVASTNSPDIRKTIIRRSVNKMLSEGFFFLIIMIYKESNIIIKLYQKKNNNMIRAWSSKKHVKHELSF